jgi:acylphosphatase
VGFRYHTRRIAQHFPVKGFVQNLTDGRVLLVVESAPGVLDQFVTQVHEELGRFIEGQDVSTRLATGEFRDFRILH